MTWQCDVCAAVMTLRPQGHREGQWLSFGTLEDQPIRRQYFGLWRESYRRHCAVESLWQHGWHPVLQKDTRETVEENDKGILENANMFPYVNKEEIILFLQQYQKRIGYCLLIIEKSLKRLMYTVWQDCKFLGCEFFKGHLYVCVFFLLCIYICVCVYMHLYMCVCIF